MDKFKVKLCFMMGTPNVWGRDPLFVLEEALKGGITCFFLREKGPGALTGDSLKAFALRCKKLCHNYNALFIVNDDIPLALEVGADGVHIEQFNGDAAVVRRIIGDLMILGVSVKNGVEAIEATDSGVDYLMISPLYDEKKTKHQSSVLRLVLVRYVASLLPGMPVIGGGGISERKIPAVIRAGASGVAVSSAILKANEPAEVARAMKGTVLISLTGVEM